jgi:hypothetical protein
MNIALHRLASQHLSRPGHTSIGSLVRHMTAMQAQDYGMAKWAIGVRLPGTTDDEVTLALNRGEIIRTHLLRPTWHIVAAGDLRWMLALTAPHVRRSMASRHRELEITPALETKSMKIMEREIGKNGSLSREEIGEHLGLGGIVLGESRLPHLLMLAELEALICSGPLKGLRPSYALVDERVAAGKTRSREESLAELARRYFVSHGPATLRDFVWWSGLPVRDARQAIAALPRDILAEDIDSERYWFADEGPGGARRKSLHHFLPAYDEFLIAYADRSASLPPPIAKGVVSSNGIFRAVVIVNGRVVALWSRSSAKGTVRVGVTMLDGGRMPGRGGWEDARHMVASFMGKKLTDS